ncbi:MAG: DMT family transporter [Lachnospiraceae bacterium]|nr:DMT family transporter [Lachnospiraceae bacterium]
MNKKAIQGNLMLLLTAMIWGVAFVAQSGGMDYVEPFTFNASRNFLATLVLLPVIRLRDRAAARRGEKSADSKKNHGGKLLISGGILCGILLTASSGFQQVGIQYTTVGKAGFVTAIYIIIVPLLGIFIGKKVHLNVWISVALAAVGLYLLCMTESLSLGRGDLLVLCCAFCFSLHILVVDSISPHVDGVRMSWLQFLVCGSLSAVLALIFETPSLAGILAAWQPILYAGGLSSAVGYTLQIVAQKNTNPVIASLLMSLESVFSALAGWVLLNQALSLRELAGCVIMFCAIILAQLPPRQNTEGPEKIL